MHAIIVLAALTFAPAETEAPPPAPLEELADEDAAASALADEDDAEKASEEANEAEQADEAKESAAAAPSVAPPAPDAPPASEEAASGEGGGFSGISLTAIQAVSGCAALAALSLAGAIPVIGWYCIAPLSGMLAPAIIGITETVVGDTIGTSRGSLLWPVLAAYAAELVGASLTVVGMTATALILTGGSLGAIFGGGASDPGLLVASILTTYLAVAVVGATGALLTVAGTVITPAVVYALTSEPKRPGDTEFRFPGIISPSHPEESTPATSAKPRLEGERAFAMAY